MLQPECAHFVVAVPYLFVNEELLELDLLLEVVVLVDFEAVLFDVAVDDVDVPASVVFVDVPLSLEQAAREIVIAATSSSVSIFFMFISPLSFLLRMIHRPNDRILIMRITIPGTLKCMRGSFSTNCAFAGRFTSTAGAERQCQYERHKKEECSFHHKTHLLIIQFS